MNTTIPLDSPPGQINNDPGNGLIDIYYEANSQPVILSSGDTRTVSTRYERADALLRVDIYRARDSDIPVLGNVSVRPYPGTEDGWVTYNAETLHMIWTDPGVYEVRIEDVDPVPGRHNGYYAAAYDRHPFYVVHSYGLNGAANHTTISVQYNPL